jgi:hypothetical protein
VSGQRVTSLNCEKAGSRLARSRGLARIRGWVGGHVGAVRPREKGADADPVSFTLVQQPFGSVRLCTGDQADEPVEVDRTGGPRPEKRKVGGSTPLLATPKTCENAPAKTGGGVFSLDQHPDGLGPSSHSTAPPRPTRTPVSPSAPRRRRWAPCSPRSCCAIGGTAPPPEVRT